MTEYQINYVNVIVKGVVFDDIVLEKPEAKDNETELENLEKTENTDK